MRCIANVFLKQKAKCILKNVDTLIQNVSFPAPKELKEFEICIDKFYGDFIFGNRNIDVALEEYNDIFEKYDVESIVPKRMLLLIFENVVDYLDVIDYPDLFHWYYLVAKLILINMIVEEYSNSLTNEILNYNDIFEVLDKNNKNIFDEEIKELFNKNYIKLIKNMTKNAKSTKKCLNELSKSPLKVSYDIMGEYNSIVYYISKVKFDEMIFKGIDKKHTFDAFQKYGFAKEFKYIEIEHISFEVIKNTFANKINKLYFVKLPDDFFRLKSNVSKLVKTIEPKTLKYFVFLIPYKEIIERDNNVNELRKHGIMLGVYNFKSVETKSIKLRNMINYVYIKKSNVANYESVVNFSKSIECTIIEENKNSYRIYK